MNIEGKQKYLKESKKKCSKEKKYLKEGKKYIYIYIYLKESNKKCLKESNNI